MFPADFKYRIIPMPADHAASSIIKHFEPTATFIHQTLKAGEKTLIHSFDTLQEAAALAIAYLIKFEQKSCSEALQIIRLRFKLQLGPSLLF